MVSNENHRECLKKWAKEQAAYLKTNKHKCFHIDEINYYGYKTIKFSS